MLFYYNTTKQLLLSPFILRAFWILLCLPLGLGASFAQTKSQQIKQGETPTGLQTSEWASIQKQMQLSKYKAYPQQTGGYASANLAHGFQIDYAKNGNTTLTSRDCDKDFHIATRLVGIGYEDVQTLPAPQSLAQQELPTGSKVTYAWNENLQEWWTNTEKGLEQWFAIQQAPAGRRAVKFNKKDYLCALKTK